jgi:hypothetical protein
MAGMTRGEVKVAKSVFDAVWMILGYQKLILHDIYGWGQEVGIPTIRQSLVASPTVTSDNLVEQVAQLEKIVEVAKNAGATREFFRRNHFTDGLKRLVDQGFARLAGRSEQGSFYLTQANSPVVGETDRA